MTMKEKSDDNADVQMVDANAQPDAIKPEDIAWDD